MRRSVVFYTLFLTSATGGYGLARLLSPPPPPDPAGSLPVASPGIRASQPQPLAQTGSAAIPEILATLDKATTADLRRMAESLLGDPRRHRDQGLWSVLLAKWSEEDGAGLLAFVRGLASVPDREWLETKAWYAWGASDPAAASAAGGTLPKSTRSELIRGMGRKDPRGALDFALKMPDAQMNVWLLSDALKSLPPETLESLLPRAIYDVMRIPLQAARTDALLEKDPAAALNSATQAYGKENVPEILSRIAEKDPAKAVELLSAMPSSRVRALSSVGLARAWAAQDAPAALTWARQDLQGPVRQAALLGIAAVSGGASPLEALGLVEEAGWTPQGNFGAVRGGNVVPMEAQYFPTPAKTAAQLLQQLELLDPAAATQFLQNRVPEEIRAQVAKKAGMTLEP